MMSAHRNEWMTFFDLHAPKYMQEPFTRNTVEEVEFLLEELNLPTRGRILDVGCGTGRHALELVQRGYRVIGLDISSGMLREAQARAGEVSLKLDLIQADATSIPLGRGVDGAICLCEGAFGLLGSRDDPHTHDLDILEGIYATIKPGGKFVLTALNGLAKVRAADHEKIEEGMFDPLTQTETFVLDDEHNGEMRSITVRERGFVPSELRLMLEVAGFEVLHLYGGTAGAWGRRPPDLDEIELMVIAMKPAGDEEHSPRAGGAQVGLK